MSQNRIIFVFTLMLNASFTRSNATEEYPLIFNPYSLEIYDMEKIASSTDHNMKYSVACPAKTLDQLDFDREISLDGKSLFVQGVYTKKDPSWQKFKCTKPYSMAVVFHDRWQCGKILEFGYEVYYTESQVKKNFILHRFENSFGRAEEMDSRWKRFKQIYARKSLEVSGIIVQKSVWISKAMLRYNRSRWNVKWVSYFMNVRIDQLQVTCKTNDLGIRLHHDNEFKLDEFYSANNQKEVFSGVNLPTSIDGICQSQYECVEKYNLVAPYHFQTYITKPVECSNLTSIPIWYKRTKELLDYSEKFITALSEVVANRIEVITGVYKKLTFPQKNVKKPKSVPIHLNSRNNRILVPKIIYKVVSTTIDECDRLISACNFVVLIFIHNGPEILPEERLCEDKCSEWGWDSVQYLSTTDRKEKSQFIYCCELDTELRYKLRSYRIKKLATDGILNLRKFEKHLGKNDSPNRRSPNIQTEVENKMNELFGL